MRNNDHARSGHPQALLGRSPVASGLILVPWAAAFGLAGQLAAPTETAAAAQQPAPIEAGAA